MPRGCGCYSRTAAGPRMRLPRKFEAAGGRCCRVLAGDTFERTSEHSWIIDPAEPEHFSRLLLEGGWSGANPLRGVIHFWSLDVATIGQESAGQPSRRIYLVQAQCCTSCKASRPRLRLAPARFGS